MSLDGERITEFALMGGSFDLSGLPGHHIDELVYYRNLFLAVAKALWKRDHNARKLPPRFEELVQLSFVVGEGSTTVEVIHHVLQGQQLPLVSLVNATAERINEAFKQIVAGGFPEDLEAQEFAALEKVGRTLKGNQRFEFRHGTSAPIAYGVDSRDSFIREMDRRAAPAIVIGTVASLNVNLSFAIASLGNGARISGRFTNGNLFESFKDALSLDIDQLVWIDCDLLQDSRSGKPGSIREVREVGQFPPVHAEDVQDVLQLASLQDGWFEGHGQRVEPGALRAAATALQSLRTRRFARPQISMEPDGPINLQWSDYATGTVLSVEDSNRFSLLKTNVETGETLHESEVTGLESALDVLTQWGL